MTAKEIKEIRERLHLTQEEFARKLGVSVSTITRWERGMSRPSQLAIRRLNRVRRIGHSHVE